MIGRRGLVVLVGVMVVSTASAQELRQAEARVIGIAGGEVYLDLGSEAGVAVGDTLRVRDRGEMVVVGVASTTSVVVYAGPPFALTRGQSVTVAWTPRPRETADDAEPALPDRPSILDRPSTAATRRSAPGPPQLTGRLLLGSSAAWSSVEAGGGSVARSFATPFAGLRARLDDLPAGLYVAVDGRTEYRYRSTTPFDRPGEVRLHRMTVGTNLGMVQFEAGRLRDPYDRFTGSVDGMRVHVGGPDRGVGLSAGFEPEWRVGAVSNELPRLGATAHTRFLLDDVRGELVLLGGTVLPRNDDLEARRYGGAQLRASGGAWRLALDALFDREPASGAIAPSRLFASGNFEAAPGLVVTLHAARRRSYVLTSTLQAMRPPSDRLGGGLAFTFPGFGGTTIRADAAYASAHGVGSVSVAAGASARRLPGADVGVDVYATGWQRQGRYGATGLVSISREIGQLWLQAGYRVFVSEQPLRALVVHGVEATLQVPVAPRAGWTLQVAADITEQATAARAYTGIWIRL